MSSPETTIKFKLEFNTDQDKKKSWTFNHIGTLSSSIEERLKNIAKSFVQYPCFTVNLVSVETISHITTTTRDMTEGS